MKLVAVMLLALMLSACNPELIEYPSDQFFARAAGPVEAGEGTAGSILAPERAVLARAGQADRGHDRGMECMRRSADAAPAGCARAGR